MKLTGASFRAIAVVTAIFVAGAVVASAQITSGNASTPTGTTTANAPTNTTPASNAVPTGAAAPTSTGSISHTTKAMNYRRAGGGAKVAFLGTDLMKGAIGEAKVQSKNNHMEIEAKFERLDDATKFGLQYLTYVFWAISPQGRAENLGELVLKNGSGSIKAETDMQTFGMIVTAEPYFAVTQPGNMVVVENNLAGSTAENIDATYELLSADTYSSSNTRIDDAIFGIDRNTPLELFEARNAIRIARNAGAEQFAKSGMASAEQQLQGAEQAYRQKRDIKTVDAAAHDVVETAEEARVMAVKQRAEQDALAKAAAEKKAAEDREAQARAEAAAEVKRTQEAEQARLQAEQAKAEAERMKQEAEAAAQEAAREKQEAEQARQAALAQQQAAEAEAQKLAEAKAAAEADADKARQAAAQAEAEKVQLRAQLRDQLNAVLQTRDSARGLIVNMSDVLFDTASYTLKPDAREKLAKISGILLAHPGLMLQIEGYTDSVGSDEFNLELSEKRADSVRDFLGQQGVPMLSMTARGLGKTQPVASNDTTDGRQKNRRVELVVNGDAIGESADADVAKQTN